jgi:DNA invertase Pin-like site-specific DNA recombinase
MKNSSCFLYARVSSDKQEDEGYSIPAQLRMLQEYADRQGFTVTEEFIDVETAKQPGRSAFNRMVKALKAKNAPKILLVEKTDRLTRNYHDELTINSLVQEQGVSVHYVKEGEIICQNASSHTKLIHNIKVALAQHYVDNLSEEIKKGKREKAKQGGWSSKAPLGYQMVKGELQVDPEGAAFVKKAFSLFASGIYSLRACADKLFESGLIYKPGIPVIQAATLQKILTNRLYLGEVHNNGERYPGRHQPLVDEITFQQAQRALRKDNKPLSYTANTFVFRGIVNCGECGSPLVGELKKGGKYTYYRCVTKAHRGECSQGYINEIKMSEAVKQTFLRIRFPEHVKDAIGLAVAESDKIKQRQDEHQASEIRRKLTNAKSAIQQAYRDRTAGIIDAEFFQELAAEYKEKIQNLEIELQAIGNADIDYYETVQMLFELGETLYSSWIAGTVEENALLLKLVCSNFSVKDGNPLIELKEPFRTLANTGTCKLWWSNREVARTLLIPLLTQHSVTIRTMHQALCA